MPWVGVACQGVGASSWWPCKDHLSDKPDSVRVTCSVPKEIRFVGNGNLESDFQESEKRISELQNRLEEQKNAILIVQEKSKNIADVANLLFSMQSEGESKINDPKVVEALKNQNVELVKEKGIPILKIDDAKVKIELDAPLPSIASILFDESKKQKGAIPSICLLYTSPSPRD